MNGHRHEWITETLDNQTCYAYCNVRGCEERLSYSEIENRLNICEILLDENILEECARIMEDVEWDQMEKRLRKLDAELRGTS